MSLSLTECASESGAGRAAGPPTRRLHVEDGEVGAFQKCLDQGLERDPNTLLLTMTVFRVVWFVNEDLHVPMVDKCQPMEREDPPIFL